MVCVLEIPSKAIVYSKRAVEFNEANAHFSHLRIYRLDNLPAPGARGLPIDVNVVGVFPVALP